MAGRPRKKPEYNPELQFNNFLQELRDAYEEADSLRSLADELNISLLKLRKLLITADVFTSDICIVNITVRQVLPQLSVFAFLYYRKYSIINISKDMREAVKCQVHTVHYV